ncbi:pilus assembly protein TadG-related protein [Roseovarius sp. D22-M7]|uniref:pilus assembly protein TadG-related protein n=1 Tax=Roseovarius sp. D22-M7 TaxID=3127116 RepID=UPI00300FBC32
MSQRLMADTKGGVAITVALSLPVILGFGALAVEYSTALLTRAENQRISDIAAYAAASEYKKNVSADPQTRVAAANTAAGSVATLNGVSTGVTVSFDDPANATHVDVVITEDKPILLSRLVSRIDSLTINTTSRVSLAEAGGFKACLVALDPSAATGVRVDGSPAGAYDLTGCGIGANAEIAVNGSAAIPTKCAAPSFKKANSCDEETQQSGFTDPFAGVTNWPYNASDDAVCDLTGKFPDDFLAKGGGKGGKNGEETLEPGVLCVTSAPKKNFGSVASDVDGSGNTLIIAADVDFTMRGNATLSIKPQESGALAGVAIYAPGSEVDLGGTPDFSKHGLGCLGLVAGSWRFGGNVTVNAECAKDDINFDAAGIGAGDRPRLVR